MHYSTYCKTKESMHVTHPLSITLSQVIVNCYDMYTLAFKSIQVSRHGRYKSFTFTCTHLSQTALVKNDTTHDLYREWFKSYCSVCSFSYGRKCIHKDIIQSFSFSKSLLKYLSTSSQLII